MEKEEKVKKFIESLGNIEYHNGVQHLADLLRASGFNVVIRGNKKIGLIYARG